MKEKDLSKIALLITALGLLFLWWFSSQVSVPSSAHLQELPLDQEITVRGRVTQLHQQEKVLFLEIDGETIEKVPVILFPEEEVFLQEGDYLEVQGKIRNYKGKKEIIASEVKIPPLETQGR